MGTTMYSFANVALTIAHPLFGQYVANGAGLGDIGTTMVTERTAHEISADGSVMVSKIKGRNGSHSIAVQQTSDFNQWLVRLYNFLEVSDVSQWAQISIVIRSPLMHDLITSTGVSFQKLPDKPYQAQGQKVTWVLMSADIQQDTI